HRLLAVMDGELAGRDWLVGSAPTLADVAVYTYVAHAPEGNVSLDDYPNVRAWLARVEALPGFVAMPVSKVGLRA
ncbi:glutathione binding-like protein, partial [Pseudomonas aeruginosa]|uniref:glutathione binding-like protein n=2 Tax=Pseudomonadota TaxID=1224 RepID=UPI002F94AD63